MRPEQQPNSLGTLFAQSLSKGQSLGLADLGGAVSID
jgi:hypothetical protein